MTDRPVLYDYWRSSASYRVRIALNLAGVDYDSVPVNLLDRSHRNADHLARNPQGLVPVLDIDGLMLTQSLAIIEYLDETRAGGLFLPDDSAGRARVRALSYAVAMEIHPICNLAVIGHVAALTGGGDEARKAWTQKFIRDGLVSLEAMLARAPATRFCHGDRPTMADLCLIPQLYNARRWEVGLDDLSNIRRVASACEPLEAFRRAHPDHVRPD
jgi:maleylacetoacetate isomerase